MKRTEIATIVFIAGISIFLTFTAVQWVLTNTAAKDWIKREVKVPQAQEVSSEITQPSKRIFNRDAINPTVEVCVETVNNGVSTASADCRTSAVESQSQPADVEANSAASRIETNTNTN